MRIDRIEPSAHKKGRALVFLDSGACLKVTEKELLNFGLRAGDELDDETLKRLREAAGVSNIRAKAAEMIAKRPLSRAALTRKLTEKGASPDEAGSAAEWLASIGALNDEDYAASLARECAAKGYGPAKIRSKLYEKGVPRELWDAAMSDLPDAAAQIDAYLSRKLLGAAPSPDEKRKITASLLRHGFAWDEIRAAWGRYGEDLED
ncbi:MAG: regulatory protein RecX [Oscillospiraceae bacterium]|nr:regulatory protein RecX [Oscillospiraceae bacterium]